MPDDSGVLAELADDFTARVRRGELPAIEEYTARHPELAERIRALFPTLLLLEGMARGGGEATPTGSVELTPGSQFGPYAIISEIGRGGMGIVYEALHLTLNRRVALKVLPLSGPQSPKQLERFLREARTAAGLHHTNIVPVFDVGQVGGTPYYAMQRIHGSGLDALLRDLIRPPSTDANATQPLTPTALVPSGDAFYRWAAELGVQAADALAHAHQRGVVHRDIKPSNLLLDDQGRLWITDFGLARATGDVTLTHTGQIIGTPRYMSPEQAEATVTPIDHRTDVYSLGATLYELLTRRPPVEGTTPQEVLQALLQREPIAPRRLDPKIPRDLETILLKAMARRPEDRYASAQDLADDLRRFLDHRALAARRIGVVGRTVRWMRRNPVIAALLMALVLTMTLGAAISAYHAYQAYQERIAKENAQQKAQTLAEEAAQGARDLGRQEAQRAIDQGLAYAARAELIPALSWFARPLVEKLPLDDGEVALVRQRLACFERYGGIPRLLGVVGEGPQKVCDLHPDRKTILRRLPQALELVDVATGRARAAFPTPGGADLAAFFDDGRRILALCTRSDPRERLLLVLDTADGKERLRLPLPDGFAALHAHFVEPKATIVLVSDDQKTLAACRLTDDRPAWRRQAVAGDAVIDGLSSGPNGELYVVGRDRRVETWSLAGMKKKDEVRWDEGSSTFQLEPLAGQLRLLTLEMGRRGSGSAYLRLPFTGTPEAVVEGVGQPMCLAVRPDGKRLVTGGSLVATPPQVTTLWDVPERRPLFRWPGSSSVIAVRFLNDGRWVALEDLLRVSLWDLPPGTPDGRPLLPGVPLSHCSGAALLPGGARAILLHGVVGPDEAPLPAVLDLRDADGKVAQTFPLQDRQLGWFATPNGRFVVTFRNDSGVITLHDTDSGKVLARVKRPGTGRAALCLSEDGATLLRLPREAKAIEVIDTTTGQVRATLELAGQDEAPLAGGWDLAISPDGHLAASLFDGRVQMWNLATGKPLWSQVVPEAVGLGFDGTGRKLVLVEETGVRLWDVSTGQPRSPLLPGTADNWVASWDDSSRRMALAHHNNVVVWDAVEGRPLTPRLSHPELVLAARLAEDGRTLTTVDSRGTLRTWDLSPDATPADALPARLERTFGYRVDAVGRITLATTPKE
jgi:WD40 repeat protein